MSNFEEDMNAEIQLQAAFAANAQLRDQIDALNRLVWSLEERLRISDRSMEGQKRFYENQMDAMRSEMAELRKSQQGLIDAAVSQMTKSFEEQIAKLVKERDAALLSARGWRGKAFGRKSERNAGRGGDGEGPSGGAGSRESEKADFVDAESQGAKETGSPKGEGCTLDAEKLVKKLKRSHPGAEVKVERVDYGKAVQYMSDENVVRHSLSEYFTLSDGEYFRTGADGKVETSWYRVIVRYPERYDEHLYEAAHVRSRTEDEYRTTDVLDVRPVPGCMFDDETLTYVLCEKYQYHTPFRQIVRKLRHRGLNISRSVLGEHVHRAIEWFSEKMSECWMAAVRRSWILMLDETRVLVGVKNKETEERNYRDKYMWGIRANSANLVWFLYEDGSRGAAAISPFLEGFQGFYTTDGYVVYKIFDSRESADAEDGEEEGRKGRRSACLVHIRRKFVDAIIENRNESMWFINEIARMFAVEYECVKRGLKGKERLLERLKKGNTADIMRRIEERLEVFRKSGYAGCGEMLKSALKYASAEWPAMKRVLECGDVELSNNLSEQMMRNIKMNLKTAGNIGSEESARHNAFMFSVIESCRMSKRSVEEYLKTLMSRLRKAGEGEDLSCCLPCHLLA